MTTRRPVSDWARGFAGPYMPPKRRNRNPRLNSIRTDMKKGFRITELVNETESFPEPVGPAGCIAAQAKASMHEIQTRMHSHSHEIVHIRISRHIEYEHVLVFWEDSGGRVAFVKKEDMHNFDRNIEIGTGIELTCFLVFDSIFQ